MNEQQLAYCDKCGHIEWQTRLDLGECRICTLFSANKRVPFESEQIT